MCPPTSNDGAGERIRTPDQRFTKPLLYQLSYAGNGAILLLVALRQRELRASGAAKVRDPGIPSAQETGGKTAFGAPAEGSRGGGQRVSTASRPSNATAKRFAGNS